MNNIIFDYEGIKVQIRYICEHAGQILMDFLAYNESGGDISYWCNIYSLPHMRYYSKVSGVFNICSLYGASGSGSVEILSGFHKELQVSYGASKINEGDYFDFECYFSRKNDKERFGTEFIHCPRWRFSFNNKRWVVKEVQVFENSPINPDFSIIIKSLNEAMEERINTNPFEELDALIGLDSVKEEVKTLANFVKIQKLRENKGLKITPISYHCVFTGNPGTGKTTVARIVANIYRELGILKKGHLVETDRSGLIGQYVGHTAEKTNKVIDSALDGVLFIDEAYALAQQDVQNDFGQEAIATLLKRMEDDRARLIVIIAGYSKEMKDFIDANSGLKSRFVRYINFPDYSVDELFTIFEKYIEDGGYEVAENAVPLAKGLFATVINSGDRNFGNGRYVRNLYEEAIKSQANRIASKQDISDADLVIIEKEDIESASRNIKVKI